MNRPAFLKVFVLASAGALLASAGCSDNGLKLGRVSGTVTYKGQPLTNGMVMFMPDEEKGTIGPPAAGSITPNGKYVMSTKIAGDGALVGTHKVGIIGVESTATTSPGALPDPETESGGDYLEAKALALRKNRLPKYQQPKPREVFTDKSGKNFNYVIPKKLSDPRQSGIIATVNSGSNTLDFVIDENDIVRIKQ